MDENIMASLGAAMLSTVHHWFNVSSVHIRFYFPFLISVVNFMTNFPATFKKHVFKEKKPT